MLTNFKLACVSLLFCVVLAEVVLRMFFSNPNDLVENEGNMRDSVFSAYTAQEMDRSKPLYAQQEGGTCVGLKSGQMAWHPYYGFNARVLDKKCARELFSQAPLSLVFLGGSVMANSRTPNYLTTIDKYVHDTIPSVVSINLAESGARSTNELVRLLLEVIEIKPDIVVFLDGFNEFNSIRYGGESEHDFYWTAGVKFRVHSPLYFVIDKFLDTSQLLKLAFLNTKLVSSPRGPQRAPTDEMIERSAQYYLDNISKANGICTSHNIKCLFFLQPYIYKKQKSELELKMEHDWSLHFPGSAHTLDYGYQYIREHSRFPVVDLSDSLSAVSEIVMFDVCHVNKVGNKILGEAIGREIQKTITDNSISERT